MRLSDAIARADELKPNRFSPRLKEEWINALQRGIYDRVISNRRGADEYEFEKADIEGSRSLPVSFVRNGTEIVLPTGPAATPYPIIGQRIFAGNDYYTVLDTDYSFDPYERMWGIYVQGPVPSDTANIYPAATVFRKGSDELIISGEYEELYIYWLFTKIDFFNRETVSCNNSRIAFNEIYDSYVKSVLRNTLPLSDKKIKYSY
ncbi:MAG: hypothetical protein MJ177_10580 [Clostridia bacterium]|nr:hypothetical protein [Clostridia bacterium]